MPLILYKYNISRIEFFFQVRKKKSMPLILYKYNNISRIDFFFLCFVDIPGLGMLKIFENYKNFKQKTLKSYKNLKICKF